MSTIAQHAKAIFLEAVEKHSPGEWPTFLDEACSGYQELRQRVEGLLQAHVEKDSLFDRVEATDNYGPPIHPGQMIGPYKIREQIGDGGMGIVYVAEQAKPLPRKVALKVIKPGMDSKAVLARFDAERNALALMNHPSIAKVLDAGTTEQGHPYFVMELIQGQPITEYCDEKQMTISQRLELFTLVCKAVQHAHQKGVIHRDIKPNNVLVTEIDGKPVPKVIDFGVAKALGTSLTDRTVYTSFQALIGTPLYMSPEQAKLSGVDVDTSSDVYSLGILLYELLTGTTPLSRQELKQAAQEEVLRQIRETVPPSPSQRISALGETSSSVSECRGTQPEQLGRLVRGDLDWIVLKALEKDRSRRYPTADAFAADLGRHLANEPVEARPPSTAYRLNRFYRRNKAGVWFASGLATIVLITVPITSLGWLQAGIERRRAIEQWERAQGEAIAKDKALAEARELAFQVLVNEALQGNDIRSSDAYAIVTEDENPHRRLFVEGLAAYIDADYWEASTRLRELLHHDPENNLARAFLASSCIRAGHDDHYAQHLDRLAEWEPTQDLERLAKAVAVMHDDPEEALDLIKEAQHQRSLVKLQLFGEATLMCALRNGDLQGCLEARDVFRQTEIALRGNRNHRMMKMTALLFAVKFAQAAGDHKLVEQLKPELHAVGHGIETDCRDAGDRYTCWLYLLENGEEQRAWSVLKGVEWEEGSYAMMLAMDRLLNGGDPAQAARDLRDVITDDTMQRDEWAAIARAHVVAANGEFDDDCWDHVRKILVSAKNSFMLRRHALYVWCLRGDADEVRSMARLILEDYDPSAVTGSREFIGAVQMLARYNGIGPQQLLERAEELGGDVYRAHFVIALDYLASGQEELAWEHFVEASESKWFDLDEAFARVYRIQLARRLGKEPGIPATILPGPPVAISNPG